MVLNLLENQNISQSASRTLSLEKRRLGRTELMVSPICFGSLRLRPEDDIYRETVKKALESGIDFIDTSGTYGHGASEIVIGEALRESTQWNQEVTKSLVLCTKMGLVRGPALQELNRPGRQQEGFYQISEKLFYCLTPEFLESQISLSLRRLQRDKVNILLLQNPEYLLKCLPDKKDFLKILKRAFEHLEVEVSRGRIDHYGISSHAFLSKDILKTFLSLTELFQLAQSISRKHHFSVVQVPFNLFESMALLVANQERETFFESAKKYDLGVLSCRPLKSRHRDKIYHFITFSGKDETAVKGHLYKALMEVVNLEKSLQKKTSPISKFSLGGLGQRKPQ